jgi:hypothetical protein
VTGDPIPPTGVVGITHDGTRVPLDCEYLGEVNGIHQWLAPWHLPYAPHAVEIDFMPARSDLVIAPQGPIPWKPSS